MLFQLLKLCLQAHLEKSLRVEIEENNMKIEALNSEILVLQNNTNANTIQNIDTDKRANEGDREVQLINFSNENEPKTHANDLFTIEASTLSNKIEKMDHLLNKYKESLKTSKDKNTQMTNDLQILSTELGVKNKKIEDLKATVQELIAENKKIQELHETNEELQNKINAYDFAKSKEVSTLETDLQKAKDEIEDLQNKVAVFSKREEDYAISLAENKLSIHKELEDKEAEIKSLKLGLSATKKEIQSLNIVIDDYKSTLTILEEEKTKFNAAINELKVANSRIPDLESKLQQIAKKFSQLEQTKSKLDEDYKCLQLQLKQETAEKLAMIDRNVYLENRNMQISEENSKKSYQISTLENELVTLKNDKKSQSAEIIANENNEILTELNIWKTKYEKLESEIQDERVELVKLQSEIEKLLVNHELIQSQNTEFCNLISDLKTENVTLHEKLVHYDNIKTIYKKLAADVNDIQKLIRLTSDEAKLLQTNNRKILISFNEQINVAINGFIDKEMKYMTTKQNQLSLLNTSLQKELIITSEQNADILNRITKVQEENDELKSINSNLELQISTLNNKINALSKQYEVTKHDLQTINLEKENLSSIIKDNESKSNSLQSFIELEQAKHSDLISQITLLENEKQNLLQKVISIEETNLNLKLQLETLIDDHNNNIEELVNSKNAININLVEKTDELNIKMMVIDQLEKKIKLLTEKNLTLEMQAQNIACNVKELESEINDVRISHADLVIEKERLSSVIEKLENTGNVNIKRETKDTQTEISMESTIFPEEIATLEVSELNYLLKNQTVQLSSQNENIGHIRKENRYCSKCASHKSDHDVMKEENRRLKSDIEGLQTYLTKISKENCVLNDKLRESIATSEHSAESDIINNLNDLKSEIQAAKEKIENLLRENMLLVEENLELKDQLQIQNYTKLIDRNETFSENESRVEMGNVNEKYDNLLQINSDLEHRLRESEDTNKSVNTNMQQMQEKNEKLRSSNEKLERRLDEALVSLRHLHSLQENTELEYLRNILYEYLTGTGTHSVTLAKVLSAIVKFDDTQTQLVLQKEKERQGLVSKY